MKLTMKLWILVFGIMFLANVTYAETPSEQLNLMVGQLQKNPSDNALREQIIKLAQTITPAPMVPEEAERHMAHGTAAFKGAQSVADYKEAAKEFEQATLVAPWYGDAYYNLGVAQDKAENHDAALSSLNLARLALPEAKEIKSLIFEVEYRNKKAKVIREAEADMSPGKVFRDCPDCPEMVILPAGSSVFAIGKYEVTQGEWRAVMGNNPSYFKNCGDNCPVEQVSWNDAKDFISRLNSKTGKQYRLPTEAEWEYACRAGRQQEYCGSDSVDSVAWYDGNSGNTIHLAGRKQSNAFGLYDMSGNVLEWVEDCYNGDCQSRVRRGGSWYNVALGLRASLRFNYGAGLRVSSGFRLARTR